MLRQMTARQLIEWEAFSVLEPFDPERNDIGFAYVVQTLMNIYRKRGKRAISLKECMLNFGDSATPKSANKKRSWQEMKMIGLMLTQASKQPEQKKRRYTRG